ncbi:MAG: DUF4905 domain-containing protein [Cytophagaceae bacterium]
MKISINRSLIQQKYNPLTITFSGQIWRLLPSPSETNLFVETRNADERETSFYAIDVLTGKTLWKGVDGLENKWWIGMESVQEEVLVLHGFGDKENPGHKGIFAVSAQTGKLRWRKDDLVYSGMSGNAIEATKTGSEERFFLDSISGNVLENVSYDQKVNDRGRMTFPSHYPEGSEYYNIVSGYIKKYIKDDCVFAIDYLEFAGLVIISYHKKQGEKLSLNLLVLTETNEIFAREILAENLTGISADTFFIYENALIYIAEKTKLNILNI